MKIIFLGEAGSIHTIRWVNSLSEKGIEVILVSLKGNFDNVEKISKKVKVIYLPFGTKLGYYLNVFALKKIISKEKPDLINAHYASGYGTLGRLSGFNKKLLNVWGSDVYDFPNESKLKKRIIEKNLKNYTAIASTSYCMAEETKKYLENKSKEIFITPFGVDTEKFKNLNIEKKENEITIGIVKTLTEKYGIEYLIKAIKELENILDIEINKKIRLLIYGKGELKNKLEDLTKELQIEDKVIFKGYISNEDVPKALNEMDIFVVPSILDSESFGVAAVEAMACEIPVIASSVGGLKEVIVDKETGYLVPKKDHKEIAKYLKKLILDKNLRTSLGKNGRKRVLENYDWNSNVDYMIKIYREIVNE
ncbi:glycosyltransferase [Fusobacterium pseudoperiodonticum]|jgi:glycosyltransferase|uniref:glycosyltransferase n=1 Tax=Fusobacterium pseudoperiodonticum TaxID=2663009 RepID=UPI0028D4ED0D|nr:glycosyltransferase [Fusobacterium pseudoperiodonticum]